MQKMKMVWTSLLFAAFGLVSSQAVPVEQLLPADTVAVIGIEDVTTFQSSARQTSFYQLWQDPAMARFKSHFEDKWNTQVVEPLEKAVDVDMQEIAGLIEKGVVIGLVPKAAEEITDVENPEESKSPDLDVLLLADSGNSSKKLDALLSKLSDQWTAGGRILKTNEVHGVRISSLSISEKDLEDTMRKTFPKWLGGGSEETAESPATPDDFHFAKSGDIFLVSTSYSTIQNAVLQSVQNNPETSLGSDSTFMQALDLLRKGKTAPFYGYFSMSGLRKSYSRAALLKESFEKQWNAVGLGSFKGAGFALHIPNGRIEMDMFLHSPGERQGLLKLITPHSGNVMPPAFVASDVGKFLRARYDLTEVWTELENLVQALHPQAAGQLEFYYRNINTAASTESEPFDFKKDFIHHLGREIVFYSKVSDDPAVPMLESEQQVWLLHSRNPQAFAKGFQKILKAFSMYMPNQVDTREYLGKTIYSVQASTRGMAGQSEDVPQGKKLHYTILDQYVAFSNHEHLIEEAVRNSTQPISTLAEDPRFTRAVAMADSQAAESGLLGFSDYRKLSRRLMEHLRNHPDRFISSLVSPQMATLSDFSELDQQFRDWVDLSLLPPFADIEKYFSTDVQYIQQDDHGIHFHSITAKPAEVE